MTDDDSKFLAAVQERIDRDFIDSHGDRERLLTMLKERDAEIRSLEKDKDVKRAADAETENKSLNDENDRPREMVDVARKALTYYASPSANDNQLNRSGHVIWENGRSAKDALAELDRLERGG